MAKQIKVIKCPHCGNTKPLSIGKDHYSCDKCGTEFFLDNDDININVNHSYDSNRNKNPNQNKVIIIAVTGAVFFFLFIFVFQLCTSTVKNITKKRPTATYTQPTQKTKTEYIDIQLLQTGNKPIVFYFESRNNYSKDEDKNGLFAIFYDFINNKAINETKVSDNCYSQIDHRYFYSNKKHYYTVDYRSLWEINADQCLIRDITNAIAQTKPALNSGFSTIRFVDKEKGDGLILTTNLGKAFYYFPTVDQLYTHNAFTHVSAKGMEMASDDAILRQYYLFQNKESRESSNVAQLMQITYKYNNGGPENMLTRLTEWNIKNMKSYRIVSIKPITENRICFFPEVFYSDSTEVLISYRPTLAEDAPQDIELLTTDGATVWKVTHKEKFECKSVIKTDSTYYLQANEDLIFEIKRDGKKSSYKLK